MKTLSMAIELEPDYAQWNYTVPYPGTELWADARNHGRFVARHWGEFSNWYPSYLPSAYDTPEDLVRLRKEILRRFYLRPASSPRSSISSRPMAPGRSPSGTTR